MTKNIFIINAGTAFRVAEGKLSRNFVNIAEKILLEKGYQVQVTHIDNGYETKAEVIKIQQANSIILQIPGWWMSYPWILKKYLDEVSSASSGMLFDGDGRHRSDKSKKYGSGGLSHGKTYMLSTTWNAPLEAFNEKDGFFEGVGIDGLFFHLHKAMQFMGFKALPTFLCCDIYKNPQIEKDFELFKLHLNNNY